ncbi:universal stress protein [Neolewinella antarctica]|uniref:Nucleotide-binding universal stress UspA family protein n=1 Tax=Neolewinella antarctica TaxID=442734 RepID=A0ABX0X8M9_9BACT|nr:universal stress protein [Neolewinella antarctica]NJC25587.1 nucleotide-binding universal stress UspA family protein [Neolewinella antarctica]
MKKIIVPIDFSDTSANALRYACYLADVTCYDLEAVHAYDGYDEQGTDFIVVRGSAHVHQRIHQRVADFVADNSSVVTLSGIPDVTDESPSIVVRDIIGSAVRVLLDQSEREDVAFIVMGGVGSGRDSRVTPVFGSVARAVTQRAKCPVLLIPANAGTPKINVAAIAFDTVTRLEALSSKTKLLRNALALRMHFVHVEHRDDSKERTTEKKLLTNMVAGHFPEYDVEVDILPAGDPSDRLLDYTLERDVDLLILGRRKSNAFLRFFVSSASSVLAGEGGLPMLIVPLDE